MTLQEQFKRYFAHRTTITTKEAMAWYENIKGGTHPARFAGLFLNVLQPMMREGSLTRLQRGLYAFAPSVLDTNSKNEEDEWDKYIASKLKNERREQT